MGLIPSRQNESGGSRQGKGAITIGPAPQKGRQNRVLGSTRVTAGAQQVFALEIEGQWTGPGEE
jgi:hypothetical protein